MELLNGNNESEARPNESEIMEDESQSQPRTDDVEIIQDASERSRELEAHEKKKETVDGQAHENEDEKSPEDPSRATTGNAYGLNDSAVFSTWPKPAERKARESRVRHRRYSVDYVTLPYGPYNLRILLGPRSRNINYIAASTHTFVKLFRANDRYPMFSVRPYQCDMTIDREEEAKEVDPEKDSSADRDRERAVVGRSDETSDEAKDDEEEEKPKDSEAAKDESGGVEAAEDKSGGVEAADDKSGGVEAAEDWDFSHREWEPNAFEREIERCPSPKADSGSDSESDSASEASSRLDDDDDDDDGNESPSSSASSSSPAFSKNPAVTFVPRLSDVERAKKLLVKLGEEYHPRSLHSLAFDRNIFFSVFLPRSNEKGDFHGSGFNGRSDSEITLFKPIERRTGTAIHCDTARREIHIRAVETGRNVDSGGSGKGDRRPGSGEISGEKLIQCADGKTNTDGGESPRCDADDEEDDEATRIALAKQLCTDLVARYVPLIVPVHRPGLGGLYLRGRNNIHLNSIGTCTRTIVWLHRTQPILFTIHPFHPPEASDLILARKLLILHIDKLYADKANRVDRRKGGVKERCAGDRADVAASK